MYKITENNEIESDEPTFSKEIIMKNLKQKKYCFNKGIYESSDPTPIPLEEQKMPYLIKHLDTYYKAGTRPKNSEPILKKILDNKEIENLLQKDQSEYLKILGLCAILTNLKKGWYNLLICEDENSPKLSTEANWTYNKSSAIKIKSDEIINCFFSQLFYGLPDNEYNNFIREFLTDKSEKPDDPGKSLFNMGKNIENSIYTLFNFHEKQQRTINQSKRSEDTLSFADNATRNLLNSLINTDDFNDYQDGLRVSLMKFAAFNQVTNDINADLRLSENIKETFPARNVLKLIETFNDIYHLDRLDRPLNVDKIITFIEDNYCTHNNRIKSTPKDLIECAKFVYKLYVIVTNQKVNTDLDPAIEYLALAALLVYDDFIICREIDLGIQGETNRYIPIYKSLSDLLKILPLDQIKELDDFSSKIPYTVVCHFISRYELALALFNGDGIEYLGKELDIKAHQARAAVVKDTLKLLKEHNLAMLRIFVDKLNNKMHDIYNTSD